MRVATVESSTLTTVAYDETRQVLELEFSSRAVYQYFSVPSAVHERLLAAASKGRYFNPAIHGRFPYLLLAGSPGLPDGEASSACAG